MYFKYGDYQHDTGEIDLIDFSSERRYSKRNRLLYNHNRMVLMGHVCEGTQAAIRTKLSAVEAAYLDVNYGKDAVLYHDDDTISRHYLSHASAINGVRVTHFSYPKGGGSEYATGRTYRIILEADYLPSGLDQIYSFSETVRMIGNGGPHWELVPRLNGPPESRLIFSQTPQRIIQSGTVVGVEYWPIKPGPLLTSQYEHQNRRWEERSTAYKIGIHKNTLYPLKYGYEFSSRLPLAYVPPREDWD